MDTDQRLTGALQENLLTLLVFDDKNCKVLAGSVTPHLFESKVYREIAGHALDFIEQYGETIKEHLPDHLEDVLEGEDQRKASTYRKLLDNLFLQRDAVNADYVITQLHKFVRQQHIKAALLKAVEAAESGDIDGAEVAMHAGLNAQSTIFEPGLSLASPEDVSALSDMPEEEGFTLGIDAFDEAGIYPRRKELFYFIAPRKRGKSWFITHCAKRALMQRWSTVIITLEMSEHLYGRRQLQSFFSIGQRDAQVMITKLQRDRAGNLIDVVQEKIERETMQDEGIKEKLVSKAKRMFQRRAKFRIKQFPTGSLTLQQLNAYLDGLERFEKFTPDLICIDYPDLMQLDSKNLRLELGQLLIGIRGIAVRRNAAVVAVSQGNRDSETATTVQAAQVAEDISKLGTADNIVTYSQTPEERSMGLARLTAELIRNQTGGLTVLLSQAYAIGQFCLDSIRLNNDYWGIVNKEQREDDPPPRRRRREE